MVRGSESEIGCVGKLQERLELARETARQRSVKAVKSRKEVYDKGSCVRHFELGNLVWYRIPGWIAS